MRIERYLSGVLQEIEELLNIAGIITYRHTVSGAVVEERTATTDEQVTYAEYVKSGRVDAIHDQFGSGVKTLRTWSNQAQATTVTQGNAVTTLQTVVDRLGVFFDRFADLLVLMDQVDIDDFD